MNFEALAAELLARPLDEFTPSRNAKARELKASGRADLGSRLSALKKPSLPLWAVNQLAVHEDRALLDELRHAAQAVVKAQAAAAAGRLNAARELRVASEGMQTKLEAASNVATAALRASGHAGSEDALRRIREMIRLAAIQGGETWQQLERGAMISEPGAGDDMLAVFGAGSRPAAGKRAERADARRAMKEAHRAARADAEKAKRAVATARRLRQQATEMAAAAERAAERAKAAENDAARAQAQAEQSQRAGRVQG